jgi:type I restriction enzyme S subunit
MSSNASGEGEIRKALIEADLVDCMIALPGQLFFSTGIPVCLWFLARNKSGGRFHDRRRQTLFIDARKLGHLVDRTHRDLTDDELTRIAMTYHAWRGENKAGEYADVSGFCKSASTDEITMHGYVLTPGRYVGAEDIEDDGEIFEVKFERLTNELEEQFAKSGVLETAELGLERRPMMQIDDAAPISWQAVPLAEVGKWYSGGTPDTGVADYWGGDIPWITASSLHDFYITTSERRVTKLGLANGTRLMSAGTVLFIVRGMSLKTEFRVGIAKRPVAFGQDCKAIVARPDIDPLFLANAIRARTRDILDLVDEAGHGTGRLQTDALGQLEILVPPIAEQREIAATIGAFDDKIALNRRMNETLEAIASALFKSWFVDFDHVHAKAEGRQPVGMALELAELFPESFEDSAIGEIPAGWQVKSLEEIGRFLNGLALQKFPPHGDSSLPVIKIAQLRKGNPQGADLASAEIDAAYIVNDGDLLFSWSGSLEVVIWTGGPGALNQHLFKVTSDDYPRWLLYEWIKHHLPEFQSIAAGKATTMGHIQRHHLAQALTVVPPAETLQCIDEIMAPLLEKLVANKLEERNLATIRDALLPKLMSGEVRLPDVAV